MASRDRVVVIVFPHVTIDVPHVGLVPEIGHAGALLINGTTGLTKYFEYGRYDPPGLGIVRNRRIPNVVMDAAGEPTSASLKATYRSISDQSGKRTAIKSVSYLTLDMFSVGLSFCENRLAQNTNAGRPPYSIAFNNCVNFAEQTAKSMVSTAVSLTMPIFNPVPHTYILALQLNSLLVPDARNIDYDFATDTLS
jgi:hypothetical protein